MNAAPSIGYAASQRRWVAADVWARSVDAGNGTATGQVRTAPFVCAPRACLQEGKPAGREGRAQQQFMEGHVDRWPMRAHRAPAVHGQPASAAADTGVVVGRRRHRNGLEDMTVDHTASTGITGSTTSTTPGSTT